MIAVWYFLCCPPSCNSNPSTPEKLHWITHDGLRFLHPVEIYPANVASSDGLITVLHRLQQLEGFGSSDHERAGSYSLFHADVAIFWQALRMLYCYSGMAPIRQDLFLALGFWHPYLYAHVAIWNEFHHTFLAPAFFLLFPNQTLMRRPRLSHSSTLFTWLRLAYPQIRALLSAALEDPEEDDDVWDRSNESYPIWERAYQKY